MDVETVQDIFVANGISMHQGLVNPIFVIQDKAYDEMQLYEFIASQDTPEASCLLLSVIERLTLLRNQTAEQYPELYVILHTRTVSAYTWYDQYCRRVVDDIDIVVEFKQMTI